MAVRDTYSNFKYYQAIAPVNRDANGDALNGVDIDTRGYEGVTLVVTTGVVESMTTSTASYYCFMLQHTNASALGNGPSDYAYVANCKHIIHSVHSTGATDLTSGIWEPTVNGDDHGSMAYTIGYIGPKRYVRVVLSGTEDAASINIGAIAVLGYPANWPVNTPA